MMCASGERPFKKELQPVHRISGPFLAESAPIPRSTETQMPNDIADRLRKNAEKVMTLWEKRVQKELDAARHHSPAALRNLLPEYLDELADALARRFERTSSKDGVELKEHSGVGKRHGEERSRQEGFTLDQVIYEYHILRQVIFRLLELEGPLRGNERDIILDSIEQAVSDAATRFTESLRDAHERAMLALIHDLRTPVTSAKLSAQTVMAEDDKEMRDKFLRIIIRSMERVGVMITELLDFSRVQAGHPLMLKFSSVELDQLIRVICREMGPALGDRLVVESQGPVTGYWSEKGLRRALENLITNAAKYGSKHAPITVSLSYTDSSARIAVHNKGVPILASRQSTIFERFRRGAAARGSAGWGIGLSFVKGVAEAHSGRVWLESSEEKGTTFFIEVPTDPRASANGEEGRRERFISR